MGKQDPSGQWLMTLAEAVLEAMGDKVDRERFLEIARETWDDTLAENAVEEAEEREADTAAEVPD